MFHKLPPREEGQGLIEYALILVLVAIVVIAILLLLGPVVGNVFSNIVVRLQDGGGGPSGSKVISFNGNATVSKSGAGVACTYTAWVPIKVTQGGVGVAGENVQASVALNGGALGVINPSGTTGGSGTATLSTSVSSKPCNGTQATVSIGTDSQTVPIN
jgi:pilus assembly protein Flp/PilA